MIEPVTIGILAKAPIPGYAKTRLIPALGAEGAAEFQAVLTARAVDTALAADIGAVRLWCAPDDTHPHFRALADRHAIRTAAQPPGDLGTRMLAAFPPDAPGLIIGTDAPALTPGHLRDAAALLWTGIEAVIIPADDGGYVLLGTGRPIPPLFSGVDWGTAAVMGQTRVRLAQAGVSWREPARLWDVDTPADLARLRREEYAAIASS